jgi:energy-coupling factor transporter ATP-binding protein EcfA2
MALFMENIEEINDEDKEIQIHTNNLSFIYEYTLNNAKKNNSEKKEEFSLESLKVLRRINLSINKGKFILLCGNTGSGKSSLVRTFNGLIPHFYNGKFYGYVKIFGKDTVYEKISELSLDVGLVFQNPENQLVALNVEREIAFGLENRGIQVNNIKKKIDEILKYLQIEHLRKRYPHELSGGEQQRVAIASILALEPSLIILDEPTATLDPLSAIGVLELLKKINSELNITVIIIEHRLDIALPYCEEIILLKDGTIFDHDTTNKVLEKDQIYEMGIAIPEYIELFQDLRKQGKFLGEIPIKLEDSINLIKRFLVE